MYSNKVLFLSRCFPNPACIHLQCTHLNLQLCLFALQSEGKASPQSCHSCDWDQPYYNDWANRPLQHKYHPEGLERPHSYNRVHTFVFINAILFCFVSSATKQLHTYTVSWEIKGPDIARGRRIDTVNRSASRCSWEGPSGAGVSDPFNTMNVMSATLN